MTNHARAREVLLSPPPSLHRDGARVTLSGDWSLFALRPRLLLIRAQLRLQGHGAAEWDLTAISRMDAFGALLVLRCWGGASPPS